MPGLSSCLATCREVREGEEEVPLFHQLNLEEIAVQRPVAISGTDCGSPWWNELWFLLHRFVPRFVMEEQWHLVYFWPKQQQCFPL